MKFAPIILILLVAAGILTFRIWQQPYKHISVSKAILTGRVASEPIIFGQSQYFKIGRFSIRTSAFPKYHYGDVLKILGKVENNRFSFPKIEKLAHRKSLISPIITLRAYLLEKLGQFLPEPASSLIGGIILGQNQLSDQFRQDLTKTGTLHVVVVSGQNVTMVGGFFLALAGIVKRRVAISLAIFAILFYTALTGFQPPTIRAAIMGTLAYLAAATGRAQAGILALILAGFLMVVVAPANLTDVSFQLSFAATTGILTLGSALQKKLKFQPAFVGPTLAVTLSAWLATAPIAAFHFGQFTPITPISNLLVVPLVPILMILGALTLILGVILPFLGSMAALVTVVPAAYFIFVVEKLATLPFSQITLEKVGILPVFGFYLVFGVVIFKLVQIKLT